MRTAGHANNRDERRREEYCASERHPTSEGAEMLVEASIEKE